MNVVPVAFDSLGTRSMATYVETDDVRVFIDPSAALGPRRYGLPPHPLEFQRLDEHKARIAEIASKCDVLIVTHYHYDHHDPDMPEIFDGKIAYLKHPEENINRSQRRRAAYFLEILKEHPRTIEFSDSRTFTQGSTTIRFSPPVPHGPTPRLGYVTEVLVDDGASRFIHTSDVEGMHLREHVDFIIQHDPDILIVDGPMTAWSEAMLANTILVMEACEIEHFIIDHHYLRDLRWKERLTPVYEAAGSSTMVQSVAEFLGLENDLLEARRKELYGR